MSMEVVVVLGREPCVQHEPCWSSPCALSKTSPDIWILIRDEIHFWQLADWFVSWYLTPDPVFHLEVLIPCSASSWDRGWERLDGSLMFLCAAEHCVCANSFFLTYCPSLRDCGTKRGDKSIHCRKGNQQLGCRNHKRWKLCVGVRIHTRLVSSTFFLGGGLQLVWRPGSGTSCLHLSQRPSKVCKKKKQPPLPPPVRWDRPYLPFNKPHPPLLLSVLLLSPLIFSSPHLCPLSSTPLRLL